MSTYTQHYSNFIGVDMSSDPRAVARNRLAYAVNMWRDYESDQGEAIETFPGFRRLVNSLGKVNGMFAFRSKDGKEYLIVHAGTRLYAFEDSYIAAKDDEKITTDAALKNVSLADSDSAAFVFNNNLYILDGHGFVVVSSVADGNGATSVIAGSVNGYIPTTYWDGRPVEQRNMLVDKAYERISAEKMKAENIGARWPLYIKEGDSTTELQLAGFRKGCGLSDININTAKSIWFYSHSFENSNSVRGIDVRCKPSAFFDVYCFNNCPNLEKVRIYIDFVDDFDLEIREGAFDNCPKLKTVEVYSPYENLHVYVGNPSNYNSEISLPAGVTLDAHVVSEGDEMYDYTPDDSPLDVKLSVHEPWTGVEKVLNADDNRECRFGYMVGDIELNGKTYYNVNEVYLSTKDMEVEISSPESEESEKKLADAKVLLALDPLRFATIDNAKNFYEGNPDYKDTAVAAINKCTKSAVFDGRIFLTGNPALPNTVFYSQRNMTGANDPTYFGAYNYFNDGYGNTPNVDLLSTPSMLMVLKNNTVQDGSVYYHTPIYNDDEYSKDLVPRVYPSTAGAAGLGSAGRTVPGTTACNFLDDTVFLSTRGLEAVGKQTVNLERTITHRSSNIDRLLINEDLSRASLAEWKGYLVICCNGNMYLADSRCISQHQDGSYQYEWYYLEALGCHQIYHGGYRYVNEWYDVDDKGTSLADCIIAGGANNGKKIAEVYSLSDRGTYSGSAANVEVISAKIPSGHEFYFYSHEGYALDPVHEERVGMDEMSPATKIVTVGERLFFGTANGDVCVINTDMRGVPDYEGQNFEADRISSKWYSFHGVAYPSICVTRLDDCSKKSLTKGTVPGTTVARLKMMPGSRVQANVSLNGRDFKKIGEAFAARYDAGDLRFDNFAFAENEDSITVLRELTRFWTDKQYSFVSEGFCEPFGLYEISYLYTVKGKIRRI